MAYRLFSSNEILSNEDDIVHRQQNDELLFYSQVVSGDIDAIAENCRQHRFLDKDGVGVLSKYPVLNLKYHFVVTAAIMSRTCIDGGMEMELSFRLSDYYISQLDFIQTEKEVELLHNKMIMDYTQRMAKLKKTKALSKPVSDSLSFIHTHIKDRITIEDIADHIGKSVSYISRIFKSEMDISVSDYIRKAKIDKAKNMLRYSQVSLVEISSYLSFSSQSHFIKLFKEETGMTPRKYRSQYYGTGWQISTEDIPESID
jgi:YesN/AraC family two-component response regulator